MLEQITRYADGRAVVDLFFVAEVVDRMFPATGDNGEVDGVSEGARDIARQALALADNETVCWFTPNVFSIRYGSSFAASARTQDGKRMVRFHTADQGDFQEGDDQ